MLDAAPQGGNVAIVVLLPDERALVAQAAASAGIDLPTPTHIRSHAIGEAFAFRFTEEQLQAAVKAVASFGLEREKWSKEQLASGHLRLYACLLALRAVGGGLAA